MAVKTKCHHKMLKVVLEPGQDLQICMDCGKVVRSFKVNERLPGYHKKALVGGRVKFNDIFWGGVHRNRSLQRGRVEE